MIEGKCLAMSDRQVRRDKIVRRNKSCHPGGDDDERRWTEGWRERERIQLKDCHLLWCSPAGGWCLYLTLKLCQYMCIFRRSCKFRFFYSTKTKQMILSLLCDSRDSDSRDSSDQKKIHKKTFFLQCLYFYFLHYFSNKKLSAKKSTTQIVIKLQNLNCDQTQKNYLWWN